MAAVHRRQLPSQVYKPTAQQNHSNDDTHDKCNDVRRQRIRNDDTREKLCNDDTHQRLGNNVTHDAHTIDAAQQRLCNDVMQQRFRNEIIHQKRTRDVVMRFGNQQLETDVASARLSNDTRHAIRNEVVDGMRDVTKPGLRCDEQQRATNDVIEHRLRNEFVHQRPDNDVMHYRLCNNMTNFAHQEPNTSQLRLWTQMDLSFLQITGRLVPGSEYLHSSDVTSPGSGPSIAPIRSAPASPGVTSTTTPFTGGITGNHSNARALIDANIMLPRPHHIAIPLPHWDFRFAAATSYNRRMFRCTQCRYVTDRRNNLKRHILTMHQTTSKLLECCGVLFSTKASLREHSMIFHFNGYNCHFCNRRFCRKALLKRHLSVHNGQKDFLCSVCDYATSHKSNLERHRRVHCRAYGEDDEMGASIGGSHERAREIQELQTEQGGAYKNSSQNVSEMCRDSDSSDSDVDSDWEINVDSVQDEPEDVCQQTESSTGVSSTKPLSGLSDATGFDK